MKADLRTWLRAEWDRVAGFGLLGVGAVILIFGYIGVSNATDTPEALCYVVSGGIGSILVFGAGATLLISADLHDEWRKLNRIEAALDRLAGEPGVSIDLGDTPERVEQPRLATVNREAGMVAIRYGATGLAAATGVLALAWWRTASELTSKAAWGGTAVAVVAVLLAGLAGGGGLASTRRTVERRKARLLRPLDRLADRFESAPAARATVAAGGAAAADGWLVVADGLTEYHRPSCPALPNHDVRSVRPEDVPAGLRPCRLCQA